MKIHPLFTATALSFLVAGCGNSSFPESLKVVSKDGCTAPEPIATPLLDLVVVLSTPVARGGLIRCAETPVTPSAKVVDGDPSDWTGEAPRFGGGTRLHSGELIHNDFVFDAYGADDGTDAERLDMIEPLTTVDARFFRYDMLSQATGDQLDVPSPIGSVDTYGDSTELGDEADLYEVRWAADGAQVYLLARFTTLTDPAKAAVLVLIGSGNGGEVGFGSGLSSAVHSQAVLLTADGALLRDLATGVEQRLTTSVAVRADGWDNALEAALPLDLFSAMTTVSVVSGRRTPEGLTPANIAYRSGEPVAIYNERLQALALFNGDVDAFTQTVDLDALRAGATESVFPAAGYHERQFDSGDNISREGGENGRVQHYGLYVPTAYAVETPAVPLTFWLHYRGGKAHSGASWTPRLIHQLGEQPGNLVVTPRGRGTSTWYVSQSHQDFFEVYADAHALFPNIDPDRRYLSGYSMGGYGTYLFGGLYPDLFAAGYSTSGAVTQGAWTGLGPDDATCGLPGGEIPGVGSATSPCFVEANEGDANAQLTYRLLENTRHFPIVIHHGTNDELALTPGAVRMGLQLATLGYRHEMTLFTGYEHFTQAIVDEWADGAAYLQQFVRPQHPREITYKIVPALTHAVNTQRNGDGFVFNFNPDRAWWVSELAVRDADIEDVSQFGLIEAESFARPAATVVTVPRSVSVRPAAPAVSTPVFSIGAHTTPYVRSGLDWLELGEEPVSNGFAVTLTRLSHATLDTVGMGLDASQPINGTVTTDGDTVLTFTGLSDGKRTLNLSAGTHELQLQP